MCCGVGSCHCQDTGVGIHCRVQQKVGSRAIMQIPAGMPRAGLRGGLFIFVQVALSMSIMQANEKILFALRSRFLVSASSFIFLTQSRRYFIFYTLCILFRLLVCLVGMPHGRLFSLIC